MWNCRDIAILLPSSSIPFRRNDRVIVDGSFPPAEFRYYALVVAPGVTTGDTPRTVELFEFRPLVLAPSALPNAEPCAM